MKFKQANTLTIQRKYGAGYKLEKGKGEKYLKHNLTFYCIHNLIWMPQNQVYVQSTWDIELWTLLELELLTF